MLLHSDFPTPALHPHPPAGPWHSLESRALCSHPFIISMDLWILLKNSLWFTLVLNSVHAQNIPKFSSESSLQLAQNVVLEPLCIYNTKCMAMILRTLQTSSLGRPHGRPASVPGWTGSLCTHALALEGTIFMPVEEEPVEDILRDMGCAHMGPTKHIRENPWKFGQVMTLPSWMEQVHLVDPPFS